MIYIVFITQAFLNHQNVTNLHRVLLKDSNFEYFSSFVTGESLFFLNASSNLYSGDCPSVRLSVRPSVHMSVSTKAEPLKTTQNGLKSPENIVVEC